MKSDIELAENIFEKGKVILFFVFILAVMSGFAVSMRQMQISSGNENGELRLDISGKLKLDEPIKPEGNESTAASAAAVQYLVSVEKGQKLDLSNYVNVKGGTKAKRKNTRCTYEDVSKRMGVSSKSIIVKKDGLVKTSKKGTAYVEIVCRCNGQIKDTEIIAVNVVEKKASRVKARKIYNYIEKLNTDERLNSINIGKRYNKYFAADKLIKSYSAFDRLSSVEADGKRNFIGITNADVYKMEKADIEKYIHKHRQKIKSVSYISEYEGFDIVFEHKMKTVDLVSYAYKHNKKYSGSMKIALGIAVKDSAGRSFQATIVKAAVGTRMVHIAMKRNSVKNALYTVSCKSLSDAMSKKARFRRVYKKSNKIYFPKRKVYAMTASRHGSTMSLLSPYRSYKCISAGSNGWCRIKLANGRIGYINRKNLSIKQSALYRAVNNKDTVYSYEDMKTDLGELSSRYGLLLKLSILTTTADKRNVYCVRMGNAGASKKIIIQSSMHAREWLNTQMIMQSIEYYCSNYEAGSYENTSYKKLLKNVCFYIVPMTNPDGVSISQFGLGGVQNKRLRKLVKKIGKGEYSKWKANARGVDLNRNFPAGFAEGKYKKMPASEAYPGKKAASEKETQAIIGLIKDVNPIAMINYHEVGSIIYYEHDSKLLDIVKEVTGYGLIQEPEDENGSLGSYLSSRGIDWCTPETCVGEAPVSHSQYVNIWKENRNVIAAVAKTYL